jgi:ankyrin repeat protein
LFVAGAGASATDKSGITPLMHAAWWGCSDAARILLGRCENKEQVNIDGQTAKDIAQAAGNTEFVLAIENA